MDKNITAAVDYVRGNLEQYEIEKAWTYIGRRMGLPCEIEDKINDLLEEYGNDNDLPECWWEDFGDIEDIFMLIDND